MNKLLSTLLISLTVLSLSVSANAEQLTRSALKASQSQLIGPSQSGVVPPQRIKQMINDLTDSAFIKSTDSADGLICPGIMPQPLFYRSGKYYSGLTSASWSTLALSANTQYFVPICISEAVTVSGISKYQTSTSNGGVNFRVGLYTSSSNLPSTIVSGTDTADTGEAAAGKIDTAFSSAVAITTPGLYWMSILTDGAITFTATSNLAQTGSLMYGAEDIGANSTGTGLQPIVGSVTYGTLPTTAGTLTYGSTGTNTVALFLKIN